MKKELTTFVHEGMEISFENWSDKEHSFEELTNVIRNTHDAAQTSVVKAINRMQTMRNWLIGYYIVEFEQNGKNRAQYGAHLLKTLEEKVERKGLTVTLFQIARNFYIRYPQMLALFEDRIYETLSHNFITPAEKIISRLSFSHIREILTIEDPFERYFYEQECIKCTWSVRELRRQISTNLYFRTGISGNPEKMLSLPTMHGHDNNELQIRNPFTFEFLGLKAKEIIDEKDLEDALIDHLQEFMLELGKGFCFESRQKRIIIDDEYYYPDLVFYNRILHCSVIVELKNEEFSHENLGQLNSYVSYYRENEMNHGDNHPVGILLCTRKGKKMVEYALAGMDNKLFVSTYMLQIPDKKTLENFLLKQLEIEKNNTAM